MPQITNSICLVIIALLATCKLMAMEEQKVDLGVFKANFIENWPIRKDHVDKLSYKELISLNDKFSMFELAILTKLKTSKGTDFSTDHHNDASISDLKFARNTAERLIIRHEQQGLKTLRSIASATSLENCIISEIWIEVDSNILEYLQGEVADKLFVPRKAIGGLELDTKTLQKLRYYLLEVYKAVDDQLLEDNDYDHVLTARTRAEQKEAKEKYYQNNRKYYLRQAAIKSLLKDLFFQRSLANGVSLENNLKDLERETRDEGFPDLISDKFKVSLKNKEFYTSIIATSIANDDSHPLQRVAHDLALDKHIGCYEELGNTLYSVLETLHYFKGERVIDEQFIHRYVHSNIVIGLARTLESLGTNNVLRLTGSYILTMKEFENQEFKSEKEKIGLRQRLLGYLQNNFDEKPFREILSMPADQEQGKALLNLIRSQYLGSSVEKVVTDNKLVDDKIEELWFEDHVDDLLPVNEIDEDVRQALFKHHHRLFKALKKKLFELEDEETKKTFLSMLENYRERAQKELGLYADDLHGIISDTQQKEINSSDRENIAPRNPAIILKLSGLFRSIFLDYHFDKAQETPEEVPNTFHLYKSIASSALSTHLNRAALIIQ